MSRPVNVDDLDNYEDDRGGFDPGPSKRIPGMRAFILFLLILALCLVGWIAYNRFKAATAPQQEATETVDQRSSLPNRTFDRNTVVGASEKEHVAEKKTEDKPLQQPQYTPAPAPNANGQPTLTPQEKAMQRRLSAATIAALPDAAGGASETKPGQQSDDRASRTSNASSDMASRMNSARYSVSKASRMTNMPMTVAAGTMIQCGNITELDTTVPGFVSCRVSRNVKSADGSVVLIDKGATITGEVSGGILQGQARAFVLWSRVRNEDGAIAYLDAPGTNRLGSAGVPGQVDTHFWERFGNAMFISVFSDLSRGVMQSLVNSTSKSSDSQTNVNLDDTSQQSDSMAREVLRATVNIPNTLTVNHGEAVSIFVPRDVDFSDVYELELTQ